ncbi:hypothetical protein [Puniceibacterium sp. IMCC21224]|uniref:hypothetical protein n=1 Tax=Puniceibacterium sp. IMCC21224 TaxID=1618204 RepID=UPI00064DE9CA|nr:hypothetical protein IMCC21224_113860 [Puniceibacterium sp. IMCC21224]
MDLDEVVLVIDAQMPIRARRIKYFDDPALKVLHAGQMRNLKAAGMAKEDPSHVTRGVNRQFKQASGSQSRGRAARAAAGAGHSLWSQLALDLAQLGIGNGNPAALASAVQTTRSIIGEHA